MATAGAADALQVVLGAHREVVVDDERDSLQLLHGHEVARHKQVGRDQKGAWGRGPEGRRETGLGEEPA